MNTATNSQTVSSASTLAQLALGVGSGSIRVVDLIVPLEPATPTIQLPPQFAPSKPFSLEEISHYDECGPAWYWNNVACGEHTGTHFDAPIHWVTGKEFSNSATHSIPVNRFIGPACVIDVSREVQRHDDFLLSPARIEQWEREHGPIPRRAWVLIRADGPSAPMLRRFSTSKRTAHSRRASSRHSCSSSQASATSSASALRPSARMRDRRRHSIRCSLVTRSCLAQTGSVWPALRISISCRRRARS